METEKLNERQKLREKIKQVERELLDKHRGWRQEKAYWMASQIICG